MTANPGSDLFLRQIYGSKRDDPDQCYLLFYLNGTALPAIVFLYSKSNGNRFGDTVDKTQH
jgi:hypothetical protein